MKLYVSDGDEVERGQLLFETVEGDLDAANAGDNVLYSTAAGVIAEVKATAGQKVNQGDVLLTVYPAGSYIICFTVPEDSLSTVKAGDSVKITFNWNEDEASETHGTVTEISYVSDEATQTSTSTTYSGYAAFEADESVRIGMNVVVTVDK